MYVYMILYTRLLATVKKRLLHHREDRRVNNIKLNSKYNNVISEHIIERHDGNVSHGNLQDNVKILHHKNNYFERSLAAMVFIKKAMH